MLRCFSSNFITLQIKLPNSYRDVVTQVLYQRESSEHEVDINEAGHVFQLNFTDKRRRGGRDRKNGSFRFSMQILAVVTGGYRFNWFSLRSSGRSSN